MDDDLFDQFRDITGATPELARQYLTLSDGNAEGAIQLFFENGGADMAASFPASSATRQPAGQNADSAIHVDSDEESEGGSKRPHSTEDDEAIARRMQQEMYGGVGAGGSATGDMDIDPETGVRRPMARTTEMLAAPVPYGYDDEDELNEAVRAQLLARQRRNVQRPGIFNQRPPPTNSVWDNNNNDTEDTGGRRQQLSRATGGASEATSKSTKLAEMYRPPFDLISPLVSWEGIRAQGKELEKWILLNVQDPNIFDCQVLNRDIWKHAEIKDTVRENFIFKQYTKSDPQAQSYVRYYFPNVDNQDAYPHIAIVDPRTGEQVKVWSGPPVPAPVEFLSQLHEFLDRYSLKANARNPVATRRPEKKKKVGVDQMTEEEMLELAMQNSLATGKPAPEIEDPDVLTRQDPSSSTTQPADPPAPTEAAPEPAQNGTDASSPFAKISTSAPHTEPEGNSPDTTRIQFRHPGGRVIRRFALQDPVRRIFEWLKASPIEERTGQPFELVFMGKNLIDVVEATIEEAGLKNGSVMVEYVED